MHRATEKGGLTESADGSIARRAEAVALDHGGRHVGLDNDGLLMEVRNRCRLSGREDRRHEDGFAGQGGNRGERNR
jgi:hypothetical protein